MGTNIPTTTASELHRGFASGVSDPLWGRTVLEPAPEVPTIRVDSINVNIGGKLVTLGLAEAQMLRNALDDILEPTQSWTQPAYPTRTDVPDLGINTYTSGDTRGIIANH